MILPWILSNYYDHCITVARWFIGSSASLSQPVMLLQGPSLGKTRPERWTWLTASFNHWLSCFELHMYQNYRRIFNCTTILTRKLQDEFEFLSQTNESSQCYRRTVNLQYRCRLVLKKGFSIHQHTLLRDSIVNGIFASASGLASRSNTSTTDWHRPIVVVRPKIRACEPF